MKIFQFGGPLGTVLDAATGLTLHPSCTGDAALPPDARDDQLAAAPGVVMRYFARELTQAFSAGKGFDSSTTMAMGGAVSAAAGAELGANVRIGSFNVSYTPEDQAGLKAAADSKRGGANTSAAAMAATMASPTGFAPAAPSAVVPVVSPPVTPAQPPPACAGAPVVSPTGATEKPAGKGLGKIVVIGIVAVLVLGAGGGVAWHFLHAGPAPAAHGHGRR